MAWSTAFCTDSRRTCAPPPSGCGSSTESPAATMPGRLVCANSPTTTAPLIVSSPSCSASAPRADPDADHDDVGGDDLAALQLDAGDPAVDADESADARAQPHRGATAFVGGAQELAHLGAHGPRDEPVEGFEHGDRLAVLGRARRHLEADESTADHDDVGGGIPPALQVDGVADVAQAQHPVEVGTLDRQPARLGARGEREPVEGQLSARFGDRATGRPVELDRGDRLAAHERDAVLVVEVGGAQFERLDVGLPVQERLRERRPLIGRVLLGADDRDRAVVAALAQRDRDLQAGLARADDEDVIHDQTCSGAMRTSSPSNSSRILIWHERRLLGWRSVAAPSSMSSSRSPGPPTRSV